MVQCTICIVELISRTYSDDWMMFFEKSPIAMRIVDARHTLKGLEYIHACGVIHTDVGSPVKEATDSTNNTVDLSSFVDWRCCGR